MKRRIGILLAVFSFLQLMVVVHAEDLNMSGNLSITGNMNSNNVSSGSMLTTGDVFSGDGEKEQEVDDVVDKADYLRNFIEKERNMIENIYKDSSFGVFMNVEEAKKRLDDFSGKFKEISDEFKKVQQKKEEIDEKYKNVRKAIKNILKNIKKNNSKVSDRIVKIKVYTKKLIELKSDLKKIEKDIDVTKDTLKKYTQVLYKINNDFYGEDLEIDNVKLFIRSENIADTLSEEEIIKSLTVRLKQLIGQLKVKRKKYNKYTQKLDELRVKYKQEIKDLKKEIDGLEEQKKYLVKLFEFFKGNRKEIKQKYESLSKNKEYMRKKIVNMASLTKDRMDRVNFSSGIDIKPLLRSEGKKDGERFLSRPVLPVKKIGAFYKDPDYKKEFGVEHKGVDISVEQGSEVYAPANGVVYKVVNNDSLKVNRMVVLHKHGYVTVYMHLQDIYVDKGDFVKRGEIIAKSGGKPGTRGAGLLSNGPHLHFEVIKNGGHMDPFDILNLSIFRISSRLPDRYRAKYMKDKYSRDFGFGSIDFMRESSLAENRIKFLQKYASGPYKNLELWKKAAEGTNVDLDMGICIGFAETGLGRNFASKWNVGNVGNNDRGERRDFSSPLQGVRAIYYTLTNKYLSKHHTINKLSRYGNKEGSIYASDTVHWQKNVNKCLSMIKGYRVPENYAFRVFPERNQFSTE